MKSKTIQTVDEMIANIARKMLRNYSKQLNNLRKTRNESNKNENLANLLETE